MTDLMELASRVKATAKPDRELDALICLAIGESGGNPIAALGMAGWLVGSQDNPNPVQAKAYTASLDAAMSLLPGDEPWDIGREGRDTYFADLTCFYPGDVQDEPDASKVPYATAWSPALALTAACLIARAHQGTAHVEQ